MLIIAFQQNNSSNGAIPYPSSMWRGWPTSLHPNILYLTSSERSVPTKFHLLAGFTRGSKVLNLVEWAMHSIQKDAVMANFDKNWLSNYIILFD